MADGSTKVVYAALIGNGLVAVTKFGAAAMSGSSDADGGVSLIRRHHQSVSPAAREQTQPRSLIAGEAVALPLLKDIREAIGAGSPGFAIAEAGTLHLGPKTILVRLRVDPAPTTTLPEFQHGLEDAERRVKAVDKRIQYVVFRLGGAS